MRCFVPAALALLAVAAAGCIPVPSLHPFVVEGEAVAVPGVVGEWADSSTTLRIAAESGNLYTLSSPDSTDVPSRLRLRFARLGGRLFADVTPDLRAYPGGSPEPWLWPMHTAFRVDLAGDSLRLAFLDDDWTKKALDRHAVKVRHERPDGQVVLTEGTAGLQAMLRKVANVEAAFDTSATYLRRR